MIQGFSGGLLNRQLIYNLDLPSFQRDFASLKTLDHGTGPAITFTRASNATYFDANGVLQTAANDAPRFDHDPATGASRGLLVEEARTNSIRNSQGGGAVVGNPGTLPTSGWSVATVTGVAAEVAATGTIGGFNYIDIKFSGTSTHGSSANLVVRFESTTQVVASTGQTWTGSAYMALVGGSFANLVASATQLPERDSGGVLLASSATSISSLTSSLQRITTTRTFTEATTARTNWQVVVGECPNGAVIDITIRFAAPQLEQGAFPTSYIPTTTAAATRSADSAVVTPISSFYNQAEGTLFAEWSSFQPANTSGSQIIFDFGDGTLANRTRIARLETTGFPSLRVTSGGSDVATPTASSALASGVVGRVIGAYGVNNFAAYWNGNLIATDSDGAVPLSPTTAGIGRATFSASSFVNGHLRKIAYYPKRLSNTLLQQLTT